MIQLSILILISAIISLFSIGIVFAIFRKVFDEEYKRPWLFIGISTIFLAIAQIIQFIYSFFNIQIYNSVITEASIHILNFISAMFLTYALLLEYLILKYFKGKFVKMKFMPVTEDNLDGKLDINIKKGQSYLALNKEKKEILKQFSQATKQGFQGFLITEDNPRETRIKYNLSKTPIAWVTQIDSSLNSDYLKDSLGYNSDIVDPLQLNNTINYIDAFLDQSQSPLVTIDLNLILRTNNYTFVLEFLKYISKKIEQHQGILITIISIDILKDDQLEELKQFLKELKE